jgi:lambda repressor-like predicted transcriptional regulator
MRGGNEMEKVRLGEAVQRHGFRKTCRESGVALTTLDAAIKGMRVPKEETAKKVAKALGVAVDEVEWPLGYGERLPGGVLRLHGQVDEMPRAALRGPVQMSES